MRYLILSDLHSNLEALTAVVAAAAGQYDRALCCGDLLGYGADPNAVVDWVRDNCSSIVRGNHDKACTQDHPMDWFNPSAREAADWTRQALTDANSEYVRGLLKGPLLLDEFELAHGSPFDEDEYVSAASDAADAFAYLERSVAFFGHTHLQGGYIWNRNRVEFIPRVPAAESSRILEIDPACAYLINPGSVGQPRDGDPRAAFVLYDAASKTATYRRTPYDIAAAQRKMRLAGLPRMLSDRLSAGR